MILMKIKPNKANHLPKIQKSKKKNGLNYGKTKSEGREKLLSWYLIISPLFMIHLSGCI